MQWLRPGRYSTVEQFSGYSDRERHGGLRHAGKGLHQGAWRLSILYICGKMRRLCNELGYCHSWPSRRNSRKIRKVEKSNAASTTSSTWLQLPNRREYHPLNSRQPRETLSWKKKRRTPCWMCYNHLQKDYKNEMHLPQLRQPGVNFHMNLSKKNLLMRNFPRLSPMQGGCSG